MILGRVGIECNEDFSISEGNTLISGLDSTSFTWHLFDPNNNLISDSTTVIITELGQGHYRSSFTPNIVGVYMLIVYHSIYFPTGKSDTIQVFENDFDTMTTLITRILGLTQENFFIDNTSYDGNNNMTQCRIRIYDNNTDVGSSNNINSTYNVIANYSGLNMTDYKVTKNE